MMASRSSQATLKPANWMVGKVEVETMVLTQFIAAITSERWGNLQIHGSADVAA